MGKLYKNFTNIFWQITFSKEIGCPVSPFTDDNFALQAHKKTLIKLCILL